MKQTLLIALVALFMAACQSSTPKNENSNISSPTVNSLETTETDAVPAFNPEHGQPHHDCSLAVGAPLVAKEGAVESEAKQVQLNPEHGQPGHRCDLAVGAPLI